MMERTIYSNYKKLMEKAKDLYVLQSAASILHWDMETKMPPRGIELRSLQLAMLQRILHKKSTDPQIGRLLNRILKHAQYEDLNEVQKRNVYLMKKNYDEQTKLPEELVAETEKQRAITIDTWKKAKRSKDYSRLRPELQKLLDLRKEAAEILMEVKNSATPYDALIDIFEPKMTAEKIEQVFSELEKGLISLIEDCREASKQPDMSLLKQRVPIYAQRKVADKLAEVVRYDINSEEAGGRIDQTEHPFTTGYYHDVRITTHYYPNKFTSSIFSTLHEAGHALYEQNLRKEWIYQPVGSGCSSGIHESQSRFVENIVGRSREFWAYFLPQLKELTGNILTDIDLDSFVHAINQVKPSKIRVEADEVTYCLHIVIRFNIERDLFSNKLTLEELPQVWNRNYQEYLGVNIEDHSEGVMQDTHWPSGLYGYFPSYALGNIYSGQILTALENNLPQWKKQISNGNFQNVKKWLTQNIYKYGDLYDPPDLIQKVTGKEPQVKPYLDYLHHKYSQLYGFQ